MFEKKRLTGIVVFLGMIVVVLTLGPLGVFAESFVATQPVEMVNAIEIELNDDYFSPKDITIPNGKTTTLVLKNKGTKKHTFTVEDFRIDVEIQPGGEKNITVKPKKAGTYELICRYHFLQGMVGKVIVR